MKSLLITIFALLFCSSAFSQDVADNNTYVKVLTFNILHGATTRGDFDLDVIAKVIKETDPDLVALQEVDFKTNRAHKYDLATELGWRTGLAPIFGKAMPYDGGAYGEGILSRYSFVETKVVALPCSPGHEPRAALQVITVLPSGDTISFIGTHLDHTKNEYDRIMQAKKINESFSDIAYPSIISGDLNAVPGSTTMNILEEMWTPTYDKDQPAKTFPSHDPKHKIDYIMFYPEKSWKVIEATPVCDEIASDHCAYFVKLQLISK